MNTYFKNLKYDLPAGLVVFLIAIPLCLGIALASGAPMFSGLISGIIGGIVIGILSNSPLSVSGPAAGLAAVVLTAITRLGAFETFLLAVALAGMFQLLLGLLKAGTIANYFPSNVIKGMLTAIGIIIILKQIPHAFGYDSDTEGDLSFLQIDGDNTFTALFKAIEHISLGATIITLVSLSILILWETKFVKRLKVIPAPLLAVVTAVLLNQLFVISNSGIEVNSEHLVNVPVASNWVDFFSFFTLPDFTKIFNKDVWMVAFTIAAVASIETLLCIEAVDKIDPEKRVTSQNRELKAQGIGNIISGLIGGLPITSVIVRSSANVNAGAKSKMAAIFHGVLLLVSALFFPALLNKIPLAALAAILLMTGYKLAKISLFKEMFSKGKYQWVPFIITVLSIVFIDLLMGVAIGMAVSVFAILRGNMKNSYFFHKAKHDEEDVVKIELSQEVSFLNKASILQTLDHIPNGTNVIIDATHTSYIDHDVLELIKEFKDIKSKLRDIEVVLVGFKDVYNLENTNNVYSEKLLQSVNFNSDKKVA